MEFTPNHVDPYLVVGVILKENTPLNPHAVGGLGEYGLMQIMPFHKGRLSECGEDLFNIRTNICYGVFIFEEHLMFCRNDIVCGLYGYNGCVTNPACVSYPYDVFAYRDGIKEHYSVLNRFYLSYINNKVMYRYGS